MQNDILKVLSALGMETKANEVMNTGLTGGGAELVPDQVLAQEIFDAVPNYGTFVGALPGYHGAGMAKKVTVPIIGDTGFFDGNSEWTTGSPVPPTPDGTKMTTGEVDIEQKGFIQYIALSRDLLNYSVGDIERIVREKIAKSMARTVEACILNGDPSTSGNVNYDGGTPATDAYYITIGVSGLRDLAITAGDVRTVGTMDFDDFTAVQGGLGDYSADPTECLWLFNRATYNKALGIDEFIDASKNGKDSTVHTGAITNILGSDLFIARDIGKALATGKIHYSTGNTYGQFIYFWKPSVQYGFGVNLEIVLYKVPGKGVMLIATFDMGMGFVQKKAGQTDPSIYMGVGVTL